MTRPLLFVLAASTAVACSESPDGATSNPPGSEAASQPAATQVVIYFEPPDVTTNVDAAVRPRVVTIGGGDVQSLAVEVSETVAAATALLKWPELARVAATASVQEGRLATTPPSLALVEVVPEEPLAEGWYAVALQKPFPEKVYARETFSNLKDGYVGSRFHVGSRPVISKVTFGDQTEGYTTEPPVTVVIEFSEPVSAPPTGVEPFTLEQPGSECNSHPELLVDRSLMRSYWFACAKFELQAEVTLAGGDGLIAKSGVPLGTLDGSPFQLKIIPTELRNESGEFFYIP